MTLTEICAIVGEIVNRPDLQDGIIKSHVQAATLRVHQRERWWRDRQTNYVTFDSASFYQTLEHDLFPRWRSWDWVRIWDAAGTDPLTQQATGAAGPFFELTISAESLFDMFNNPKKYTGISSGSSTVLRSVASFSAVLVSWFQSPNVTEANYSSWIAENYPYAIAYDAVSFMFAGAGQHDNARKWEKAVMDQVAIMLGDNLTNRGI